MIDFEELLETSYTIVISIWKDGFYVEKMDFPDEDPDEEWYYEVVCDCHNHTHFVGTREQCDEWLNPLTPTSEMLN